MSRADIGVFGSGAWGTALAITWARAGANVVLWGPFPEEMAQMAATRHHLRLKDVVFPESLQTTLDPAEARPCRRGVVVKPPAQDFWSSRRNSLGLVL